MSRREAGIRDGWVIRLTRLEGTGAGELHRGDRRLCFQVSRRARMVLGVDDTLFSVSGNVVLRDYRAIQLLAQAMSNRRDQAGGDKPPIRPSHLNAMGLIDEVLHHVVGLFREQANPRVFGQALRWLEDSLGGEALERLLCAFVECFPPPEVYRGRQGAATYLAGQTAGVPHREIVLEELLLLWLDNVNPAAEPFRELFDDDELRHLPYQEAMSSLYRFFENQPRFGPDDQNLVDMLRSPAIAVPHHLSGQLQWIRERWGLLVEQFILRLLSGLDLIKEEDKRTLPGPGPAEVMRFDLDRASRWWETSGAEAEAERFSPDLDWMPRLVLMAKSTYVWLDQLSKRYGRAITRLDQIPDEELDNLARWGFTGLWLIGIWERSRASRQIKQMCGNPEALASAYSLLSYDLAADLGGEPALENLRQRAWQRGLRLAADMVPNHMAIDSRWVTEHPDWFTQLAESPYPAYTFTGPNLSTDPDYGVYLEDHYYNRTDAAVVFKWVDHRTGQTRYLYHGNDGTSMPWNDTAQLNYLLPEVREAVIGTILKVARQFPIIRFDAAMTLTKRHYQRLWYPEPGAGGDIPSRAGRGLSKADLDRHMPQEFWREVVDRAAAEAPDTLLLAEAFWLMEGYFVRTLGMHRVYNSAFMNFLKNEDNDKFRLSIRNVLEFNPEILKRFVNFLNNPDEETAVRQFGKGDKYFGVAILMATMPGLPMFGHGQIEGFAEKYGMEYRRAYYDERPDQDLIRRHEYLVFPLLRKRYLFAEVRHFLLYDLYTATGGVDENVIAYSNRHGDERALVVFHNRYATTSGWIRESAGYLDLARPEGARRVVRKTLVEGLGLEPAEGRFVLYRDHVSGLEYIRPSLELAAQGLRVELGAYQFGVYLDFREVADDARGQYAAICAFLAGRGVPSIAEAAREMRLQPILHAYAELVRPDRLDSLRAMLEAPDPQIAQFVDAFEVPAALGKWFREIRGFWGDPRSTDELERECRNGLLRLLELPDKLRESEVATGVLAAKTGRQFREFLELEHLTWATLLGWWSVYRLGRLGTDDFAAHSRKLVEEFRLGPVLAESFLRRGASEADAWRRVALVKILAGHGGWLARAMAEPARLGRLLEELFSDREVQGYIQVNRWQDLLWFNQESFQELLEYLLAATLAEACPEAGETEAEALGRAVVQSTAIIERLLEAAARAQFQVWATLERLQEPGRVPPRAEPEPDEPRAAEPRPKQPRMNPDSH